MSEHVFKLPDLGEGTVESEIGEWNIAVGEMVAEEDIVGTMMTDKAAVELVAPVSGKVISLAGEPGDMVAVGAALVVFETEAQPTMTKAEEDKPETTADDIETEREVPKAKAGGRVVTSPAIRRLAKEAGVDLSDIVGSRTGGRVVRSDFEAHLISTGTAPTTIKAEPTKSTEIKVIGLRRVIAERMTAANLEAPHFSYVEEIDITELEALRQHHNGRAADVNAKLTLLPFLSLALIRTLREFPQCNTTYDKERNVLLRHEAVHLGVATQTPDGLKVPVVRHAERLAIKALAAEIQRVATAARDNKITKEDLGGSTITITSLGKLGGIVSTPVLNMPEVSIIGVNRAVDRPMVVKGQIAIRRMMNLSSSFDHRFVDGYDAAAMIQRMKEILEHPSIIFIPQFRHFS